MQITISRAIEVVMDITIRKIAYGINKAKDNKGDKGDKGEGL